MSAQRIQRRRTKGWRMPENTVYVGRGAKWGNPWRNYSGTSEEAERVARIYAHAIKEQEVFLWKWEHGPLPELQQIRDALAGKNLACWCPLDQHCHADVLLEIANEVAA